MVDQTISEVVEAVHNPDDGLVDEVVNVPEGVLPGQNVLGPETAQHLQRNIENGNVEQNCCIVVAAYACRLRTSISDVGLLLLNQQP